MWSTPAAAAAAGGVAVGVGGSVGPDGIDVVSNREASTANGTSVVLDGGEELQALIDEMRVQDFDSIRFATYRTACKLRFIQTKTNVHLVDIWNMIESFRENGFNAMTTTTHLKISRLELLLTSVFHSLNKRLPTAQHIDTDKSISTLLAFLLGAYDRQRIGRLTVFAVKVALATLCAGKLIDKLRYIFSQISDPNGSMEYPAFVEYLKMVLALPTAVFEAPTFGFTEAAVDQCFKPDAHVTLNQFLDTIMTDACPPCLMWLPLLHRMAAVEHVYHPVLCDSCQVRAFTGFRYKCQRCPNYQLCQSCFWRGQVSKQHKNDHEMKEYSSYKSPTKQLAHSIHKSLRCVPIPSSKMNKEFDLKPQRPLDLANLVPMAPNSLRHNPPEPITEWTTKLLPGQYGTVGNSDDEHRLIARYSAKLAGRTTYPPQQQQATAVGSSMSSIPTSGGGGPPSGMPPNVVNEAFQERAMIAALEEENNQMLREMASIEEQQGLAASNGQLNNLRERRADLEAKMRDMQQTRRELMLQLEQLMAQLNTNNATRASSLGQIPEPLSGVGSMVSSAFREPSAGPPPQVAPPVLPSTGHLQSELLFAADNIAKNLGHLVGELDQAMASGGGDAALPP